MKNVKNKVYAIALMVLSLMSLAIDRDATALIILSFISVPMFFSKESWVDYGGASALPFAFSLDWFCHIFCT